MPERFTKEEFRKKLGGTLTPRWIEKIEATIEGGWAEPDLNEWAALEVMAYGISFDDRGMLYCYEDICIAQDLWKPTENFHQAALVAAHAGMDYTIRGYIDCIRVYCKWGNEWKEHRLDHDQAHEIPEILTRGVYEFLTGGWSNANIRL